VVVGVGDVIRVGDSELAVVDRQEPPPVPASAPPPALTIVREMSRASLQRLPQAQAPAADAPRDEASVLLTDIALTPAQWASLDPTLARTLASAHDDTIVACVAAHDGAIVATDGLGRMGAIFRVASAGVGCAADVLQRLAARSREHPELPIPARLAIHTAPVDAVLAGGAQGAAAAVLAAAGPWQLAVSRATAAALGPGAPALTQAPPSGAPGAAEAQPALVDWQSVPIANPR
ncbi:MAG TPA: hypothetical protein VFO60_06560, partial [Candidatus Dormibacteraeota bacterium]|nr:hypothetical protein [Candidatus Dormibacteraeota bacterium]